MCQNCNLLFRLTVTGIRASLAASASAAVGEFVNHTLTSRTIGALLQVA